MDNPYLPPTSDTSIQPTRSTLIYDGQSLIAPRYFTFPAICLKTGTVDDLAPLQSRKLSYLPRAAFLVLFIGGPLLLGIVALIASKRGVIQFHVSRSVAERRRKAILRNWLVFSFSVALFVLAGAMSDSRVAALGGISLLICMILSVVTSQQFIYPAKIDETKIWLRGVPESVARVLVEQCATTAESAPQTEPTRIDRGASNHLEY
jgi:hypothetical protein